MIYDPCPRYYSGVPHAAHGHISQADVESGADFKQCPGLPGPRPQPNRAGREGDVQPMPTPTDEVDSQSLAIKLIAARRDLGIARYGTALQPTNGRDSLWDAVEEGLDLVVYLINAWRGAHPGETLPGLREERP